VLRVAGYACKPDGFVRDVGDVGTSCEDCKPLIRLDDVVSALDAIAVECTDLEIYEMRVQALATSLREMK